MAQVAASVAISVAIQAVSRELAGVTEQVGARMDDQRLTQSNVGAPIPEIYGVVRMGVNLIWAGATNEVRTQRTQSGKGLGPPPVRTVTFAYFGNFAFSVGQGEVKALRKVWADKKLIYDASGDSPTFFKYPDSTFRFHTGTEDQEVDPLIQAAEGDFTPAFRGLAYVVFEDFPLNDFGNRIPQMEFQVSAAQPSAFTKTALAHTRVPSVFASNNVAVLPALRKLYIISANDGAAVINMDTLVEEQFRDRTTDPNWFGSISDGGFGDSAAEYNPQGMATVLGRLFMIGVTGGTGNPLFSEFNPLDLSLLDRGVKFRPTSKAPTGVNNNVFVGTEIVTLAGPTPGVWLAGKGSALDPVGSFAARFFWVDKEQSGGFFRSSIDRFNRAGIETPFANPLDGWNNPFGAFADNDGRLWVLCADQTAQENGPAGYRAGLIRFKAEIHAAAIPLFGPRVAVSSKTFNLSGLSVHFRPASTSNAEASSFCYDKTTGYIFIISSTAGTETFYKMLVWDPATETEIRSKIFDKTNRYFLTKTMMTVPVTNGQVFAIDPSSTSPSESGLVSIDFNTFEVTQLADDTITVGDLSESILIPEENTIYSWPSRLSTGDLERSALDRVSIVPEDLEDVITPILESVGFGVSEIDIETGLKTEPVAGFAFPGSLTGREALQQLAFSYLFDVIEQDAGVSIVPRGESVAATATLIDEGFGKRPGERILSEGLVQTLDIPSRIDVVYPDPEREHLTGTQFAVRNKAPFPTQFSDDAKKIEVAVEMTGDKAAQLAEIQLYSNWANRFKFETGLSPAFLKYLPSDLLTLTKEDGSTVIAKIQVQRLGPGYTSIIEAVEEDLDTYTSVSGGIKSGIPLEVLSYKGPTLPIILDLPLLKDEDSTAQKSVTVYSAFGAFASEWEGARMEQSEDGVNYTEFDANDTSAAWGYLVEEIKPKVLVYNDVTEEWSFPPEVLTFDHTTSFLVFMVFGGARLASVTEAQVLAGLNVFAVGDEVLQAATIVAGPNDNEFIFSDLLRGRKGTEGKTISGHTTGALITCLDIATVGVGNFPISAIGNEVTYIATSNNAERETQSGPFTKTILGNSLRPFSVTDVKLTPQPKDSSGTNSRPTDLTFSCTPRARLGGNAFWNGEGNVVNGETIDEFEVVILSAGGLIGFPKNPGSSFWFVNTSVTLANVNVAPSSPSFTGVISASENFQVDLEDFVVNQGAYQAHNTFGGGITLTMEEGDDGLGRGRRVVTSDPPFSENGRVYSLDVTEAVTYTKTAAELQAGFTIPNADWETEAGYVDGEYVHIMIYQKSGVSAVGRGFAVIYII